MFVKFAAAVALTVSIGTAASASPVNLLVNGDFSTSAYTKNNQFGTGYGGQGVTGWTGNGGYDLYFFGGTATTVSANSQYSGNGEMLWAVSNSPTGGNFVGLDGQPGVQGSISQQVNGLTVGDVYSLTFSWGAGQLQSRNEATTDQLQVSLGGQSFLTNVVSNPAKGFTGWFTTTFKYTATATNEVLSFLSEGTPDGGPSIGTLDGASLVDTGPGVPVPEPASAALLALGLVGLVALRRRGATNAT